MYQPLTSHTHPVTHLHAPPTLFHAPLTHWHAPLICTHAPLTHFHAPLTHAHARTHATLPFTCARCWRDRRRFYTGRLSSASLCAPCKDLAILVCVGKFWMYNICIGRREVERIQARVDAVCKGWSVEVGDGCRPVPCVPCGHRAT